MGGLLVRDSAADINVSWIRLILHMFISLELAYGLEAGSALNPTNRVWDAADAWGHQHSQHALDIGWLPLNDS